MSHHKSFNACAECVSEADLFAGRVTHDRCPHRTARIESCVPQVSTARCSSAPRGSHRSSESERQLA